MWSNVVDYLTQMVTQTVPRSDHANEGSGVAMQEQPQTSEPQVTRDLVSQVLYRAARKQAEFLGPTAIEFIVNGENGIRLSDALDKNFAGLEGRDDRSLFDDGRAQITIRIHVRPLFDRVHH
jgi:hypothetical protein